MKHSKNKMQFFLLKWDIKCDITDCHITEIEVLADLHQEAYHGAVHEVCDWCLFYN